MDSVTFSITSALSAAVLASLFAANLLNPAIEASPLTPSPNPPLPIITGNSCRISLPIFSYRNVLRSSSSPRIFVISHAVSCTPTTEGSFNRLPISSIAACLSAGISAEPMLVMALAKAASFVSSGF